MDPIRRVLWAVPVFLLLTQPLDAGPPAYRILRAADAARAHHHSHGYQPGQPMDVHANGYAYGWFGVPSRFHKVRHHGWRNNYTQWKYR